MSRLCSDEHQVPDLCETVRSRMCKESVTTWCLQNMDRANSDSIFLIFRLSVIKQTKFQKPAQEETGKCLAHMVILAHSVNFNYTGN